MRIFYRVSSHISPHKPPIYEGNKWNLVTMCHQSFLEAGGKDYTTVYICDNGGWPDYFSKFGDVVETNLGNEGTFHLQIDMASVLDCPSLLVEDDYFWTKDSITRLEKAIETLGIVSPYDHPSHYLEERFDKKYQTALIGGYTYRTAPSNTLTFGATGEIFKTHKNTFKSFGTNDHEMFQNLVSAGVLNWVPSLSIATHMADGLLSPNIDWQSMW